jgi:hypothetical protein
MARLMVYQMQCQQCGRPFALDKSAKVKKYFVKRGWQVDYFCRRECLADYKNGVAKPDWGKWFEDGIGKVKPGAIYD